MPARITYIYHDCFVVEHQGLTLLFDYPGPEHRTEQATALVRQLVTNADLLVVASHSHPDHFTTEILAFEELAQRVRYVVSFDIADLYEEFAPQGEREVVVLDPDESEPVRLDTVAGELAVSCFESSDLGVGALINMPKAALWFGGDVACWDWENQDEHARDFSRKHFREVLDALAGEKLDIAFSNTDKRLQSWAGGLEFVRVVQPRIFVPMHVFGNTEWVWEFAAELTAGEETPPSKLFLYAATGDAMEVAVQGDS